MAASWYATGLLKPLWQSYGEPPYQREKLAAAVGTSPSNLSQINTGGRTLGEDLAQRLAAELGITTFDLGQPAEGEDSPGKPRVLDRLQSLEDGLSEVAQANLRLTRQVSTLQARLRRLEARRGRGGNGAVQEPL